MKKILILAGRYLPGHKDGGPLRTLINISEALGDEYEIHIACWDRDQGDTQPYPDVKVGEWNQIGKAKVFYVEEGGFTDELLLSLIEGKDVVYLCSFYDEYGYKTLLLNKRNKINCKIALASMGVFSTSALAQKALKKKVFITLCKMFGLFKNIVWSVTSELEADDVKRVIGKNIDYVVAEDLPRTTIPGLSNKSEGPMKIAFLSRICEHKNPMIVIDAVSQMKNKDVELTLFGPVQEEEYWNRCLQKLESLDIVWKYEGDVPSDDVQKVLSQQDVMVLPTKSENYGHVVFEAMSVGCVPVISDRTPWAVVAEKNAGFVLPLNTEEFANTLDYFYELSKEEKLKMSLNGIELAKDKVRQSKENTGYRTIFG